MRRWRNFTIKLYVESVLCNLCSSLWTESSDAVIIDYRRNRIFFQNISFVMWT
jgi:hypothetical protein